MTNKIMTLDGRTNPPPPPPTVARSLHGRFVNTPWVELLAGQSNLKTFWTCLKFPGIRWKVAIYSLNISPCYEWTMSQIGYILLMEKHLKMARYRNHFKIACLDLLSFIIILYLIPGNGIEHFLNGEVKIWKNFKMPWNWKNRLDQEIARHAVEVWNRQTRGGDGEGTRA